MKTVSRSHLAALAAFALLASSCAQSVAPPRESPPLPPGAEEFTDAQLVAVAYGERAVPDGFYFEDWSQASPYYVNTVSVTPMDQREDRWIELSTESLSEARAWAEATEAYGSAHRVLISELVTPKYFEFLAENPARTSDRVRIRAHRASYLDRSGYDLFHPGPVLGTLQVRPVTLSAGRELAEYLWFLRNGHNYGARALSSFGREGEAGVAHVIYWVAVVSGDFGMTDRIALVRTLTLIAKDTGTITLREDVVRTIPGRRN